MKSRPYLVSRFPHQILKALDSSLLVAHELGHWYFQHPSKLLIVSQFHIFAILAVFPAFRHSALLLRSFGFPPEVAANPPPIISFLLYQVRWALLSLLLHAGLTVLSIDGVDPA